jgi:hypothetical protein
LEILPDGQLQICERTTYTKAGKEVGKGKSHRYVLDPGTADASDERLVGKSGYDVAAVMQAVWTPKMIADRKTELARAPDDRPDPRTPGAGIQQVEKLRKIELCEDGEIRAIVEDVILDDGIEVGATRKTRSLPPEEPDKTIGKISGIDLDALKPIAHTLERAAKRRGGIS